MDTNTLHVFALVLSLLISAAVGLIAGACAAHEGTWWPLALAMPATFFLYPGIVWLLGG